MITNTFIHIIYIAGISTGILFLIGIYMLVSPYGMFSGTLPTSQKIRRSAGYVILSLALSFVLPVLANPDYELMMLSEKDMLVSEISIILILATSTAWLMRMLQIKGKLVCYFHIPFVVLIAHCIWFAFTGNIDSIVWIERFLYAYVFITFTIYGVMLARYSKMISENYADDEHRNIRWVFIVLLLFLLMSVSYAEVFIIDNKAFTGWMILHYIIIIALSIYIAWVSDHQCLVIDMDDSEEQPATGVESITSCEGICQKLKQVCEEKELYRDPDINTYSLAQAVGVTRAELKALLASRNMDFSKYINELRIQYAIKCIKSSEGKVNFTAIAAQSGYRQMNSFRTAFKAHTGVLPSEYLNKHLNSK